MRFLLIFLICAIAFGAGWYLHPDIKRRADDYFAEKLAAIKKHEDAIRHEGAAKVNEVSGPAAILAAIRESKNNPANPSAPQTGTPAPPAVATVNNSAEKPAAPMDPIEQKYPMPTFKSIEEITKDWSSIPSKAFPRSVKTKVPVTFENDGAKTTLPEQSDARAVGMVQGMLILMPKTDDKSRAMIPLANTDLKEILTTLYDKYKDYKRNQIVAQRERARALISKANGADETQMTAAGPKPERRSNGVITLMEEDLETRKLKELNASAITSWGDLNYEEVKDAKGLPPGFYWTGTVQVTVENPLFGPQPAECMALIKDGKVLIWLYTGSREEVQ